MKQWGPIETSSPSSILASLHDRMLFLPTSTASPIRISEAEPLASRTAPPSTTPPAPIEIRRGQRSSTPAPTSRPAPARAKSER